MKFFNKLIRIIYVLFVVIMLLGGTALMTFNFVKRYANYEPARKSKTTTVKAVHSNLGFKASLIAYPFLRKQIKNYEDNGEIGTFIVPGLYSAESIRSGVCEVCSNMVPQSLCVLDDYILIGAYCKTGAHYSVIYVLDKETYEYEKTIVLPARYHLGGMAYDVLHERVWLAGHKDGKAEACSITLDQIKNYYLKYGHRAIRLDTEDFLYTIPRTSCMAYYNGYLYIGYFQPTGQSIMQKFAIDYDTGKLVTSSSAQYQQSYGGKLPAEIIVPVNTATLASKVQGIAFSRYRMFVTESYGTFQSKLVEFAIKDDDDANQNYTNENAISIITMPQKLEQVYVDGDDMYSIYESGAYAYRNYSFPSIDRVIKMNIMDIMRYSKDYDGVKGEAIKIKEMFGNANEDDASEEASGETARRKDD